MNFVHRLLFLCLLAATFEASAQSVPSRPESKPDAGATGASSARNADQSVKEFAAQSAAESWLSLLDRGEFGAAWDRCAQAFRERVTREQWIEGMPKVRTPLGVVTSRSAELASYKNSLLGAPDGEYVTVRFKTVFDKKSAEELITLSFEESAWRPTGYSIR